MAREIYLDYQATTPVDPAVVEAMLPYLGEKFANPSGASKAAKRVAEDVESVRATLAGMINSKPEEVFFTSGATEAINTILNGFCSKFPSKKIMASPIEHSAVLQCLRRFERNRGVVEYIHVGSSGLVELEHIRAAVDPEVGLASVMHVNNEIGVIQPIREIGQLVSPSGAFFFVDMMVRKRAAQPGFSCWIARVRASESALTS